MEKYVKLEEVINLIDKLAKEPAYQHVGENWHNGVCSVGCEVCELPTVELNIKAPQAKWTLSYEGLLGSDYICSNCGTPAIENNTGHYNTLTDYCRGCGAYMKS